MTGERRALQQAALVRVLGGIPIVCPTARVVWQTDPGVCRPWIEAVVAGIDDAVFMTGMGTEALLAAAAAAGELHSVVASLRRARVVVRGSKARPILRRHDIPIAAEPDPPTTAGVLQALGPDVGGRRIAVQLAEPEPAPLTERLRAAKARVVAASLYRYPPEESTRGALPLVQAILDGDLDAITFTSAASVEGLVAAARGAGVWEPVRQRLREILVAAVGPVTAAALRSHEVVVDVEPSQPRLGPMLHALAEALAARSSPSW